MLVEKFDDSLLGWAIQFVGHYWEGRKPAFADDLVGLLVGVIGLIAWALWPAPSYTAVPVAMPTTKDRKSVV